MIGQSMKCRLGAIIARSSNFCSINCISSSRYSIYSHSIAGACSYVPPISLKGSSDNNSISDNSIICSSNIKYSSNSNSSNNRTSSIQNRSFHSSSINRGIEEFFEKKVQAGESVVIGRPWTAADLRRKSFEDLHKLWFVLYKERNMLLSEREKRRKTMKASSLFDERRYIGVKRSMAAIKFVLAERRDIEKIIKAEELVAEREKIADINRAKLASSNPAVDNAATANATPTSK